MSRCQGKRQRADVPDYRALADRTIMQGKARSFEVCCHHDPCHSHSVLDDVQGESGFRRASEKPGPTGGPL